MKTEHEEEYRYHWCPVCKYRVTDTEFMLAGFDYLCPRCHKRNLSFFHMDDFMSQTQEQGTGDHDEGSP